MDTPVIMTKMRERGIAVVFPALEYTRHAVAVDVLQRPDADGIGCVQLNVRTLPY
jgi:hypothetical protein